MKTMILSAIAALSLGVGAAYASGGPVGFAQGGSYHEPAYGAQAFADHNKDAKVHFLGPNTVLGKMFNHASDSGRVATTSSTDPSGS